jgi:hypothetical protein
VAVAVAATKDLDALINKSESDSRRRKAARAKIKAAKDLKKGE